MIRGDEVPYLAEIGTRGVVQGVETLVDRAVHRAERRIRLCAYFQGRESWPFDGGVELGGNFVDFGCRSRLAKDPFFLMSVAVAAVILRLTPSPMRLSVPFMYWMS